MGIHGVDADEFLVKSTQPGLRQAIEAADKVVSY